jgi:hypothetical protein
MALCRLICITTGNLPIRTHPYRPLSAHPAHRHHEHSRSSPAASSSSSRFAQPHAYEHRQGIAPQLMRHSFTHPGGWPDRPQHARIRGSVGSTPRARTSRPPPYLGPTPSQERLGKRKRPASAEGGAVVPQTVITPHRDSVGPQRSHRRHHNVAEKTHSTMLPSGGMFMTFPLDIPSPEPETDGGEPAGPPPFEHGPSELPPRPYEQRRTEGDSGPERTVKRGRLPADVMDHVSVIGYLQAQALIDAFVVVTHNRGSPAQDRGHCKRLSRCKEQASFREVKASWFLMTFFCNFVLCIPTAVLHTDGRGHPISVIGYPQLPVTLSPAHNFLLYRHSIT